MRYVGHSDSAFVVAISEHVSVLVAPGAKADGWVQAFNLLDPFPSVDIIESNPPVGSGCAQRLPTDDAHGIDPVGALNRAYHCEIGKAP